MTPDAPTSPAPLRTANAPTGRATTSRPDAMEWQGKPTKITHHPAGTPLVRDGQLLVSPRDGSRAEGRTTAALHAAIVAPTVAADSGTIRVASACAPTAVLLDESTLGPAANADPDGLCRRRNCRKLLARYTDAATHADTAPATNQGGQHES